MAIFDDEDFNEIKNKHTTLTMQDTFNITVTTISPLVQMDLNKNQRKRYVLVDGEYFNEPFFSANGFRGLLRRVMTKDMVETIRKTTPNYNLSAEDFYLYTSGAATDKRSLDDLSWKEVEELRVKSPILSLFGAGLSNISGKCAVSDLSPITAQKIVKTIQNGEESFKKMQPLTQNHTFFRTDSLLKNNNMFTALVDMVDIDSWKKEYDKSVQISKEKKKNNEEQSELNSHIAQIFECESIMPNVTLTSSINPLYGQKFTDVEIGLMLKTLFEISKMQIGSHKRLGYGVLDWHVELYGQVMFSTICDKDYIFNKQCSLSNICEEFLSIYDKWKKTNYL